MGRAALSRGEGLGRALREAEAGVGRQVRAPHLLPSAAAGAAEGAAAEAPTGEEKATGAGEGESGEKR